MFDSLLSSPFEEVMVMMALALVFLVGLLVLGLFLIYWELVSLTTETKRVADSLDEPGTQGWLKVKGRNYVPPRKGIRHDTARAADNLKQIADNLESRDDRQ